jgi:hypothetical protein
LMKVVQMGNPIPKSSGGNITSLERTYISSRLWCHLVSL